MRMTGYTADMEKSNLTSDMSVELAKPEDVPGILQVQKETWLNTYPSEEHGITREDILQKDFDSAERVNVRRKRQARYLDDDSGRVWVARDGSRVVGFVEVMKGDERNLLGALYVLPEFQGRKVGSRLMHAALEWLGSDKDITVTVVAYNRAKRFYERYGFHEVGSIIYDPAGALPGGKQMPEIEMVRPARGEAID
jgi:GNAT superfamily N-acetyltransferase